MESVFDTILGLPVHPLVVHFAVVLLPLATFAIIVSIYWSKFRKQYAFASLVALVLGTGAAFVAKQSGESLAERIGNPQDHANYGNLLSWTSFVFLLLVIFWYQKFRNRDSQNLLSHLTALSGIAILGLTLLTGHSGAQAVWEGKLAPKVVNKSEAQKPSQNAISLSEVSTHATAASCWSAVAGDVYDLTDWIGKHPGGSSVIKAICGRDGTASFNGQHSGQRQPEEILASYKIGTLK